MSKLVIQTQYRENYAAHNADYKHGIDQPYWKFKGGTTFVVENLSSNMINKIAVNGIPELVNLVEYSNEAAEEYVIDWEIAEDDAVVCESWETPIVLSFDEENQEWTATKFTNNRPDKDGYGGYMRDEILELTETWVMAPGQERSDYDSKYLMKDGAVVPFTGIRQWVRDYA